MSRVVTTRVYEYDRDGRMIKETVVVEDHTPPMTYRPNVWPQPNVWPRYSPYITGSTTTTANDKNLGQA